ncbi:MAG: NADH-quinone oxidoreductase subunit N [Candidatus Marsarchaeota archaeon]|nr:NADH-quinone oxidoreductase subunit N [Candidatus Marsarchaeota archaeon]
MQQYISMDEYALCIMILLFIFVNALSIFHKRKKAQLIISTTFLAVITVLAIVLLESNTYDIFAANLLNIYPFSMFFVALFSVGLIMVNIISYRYSKDYFAFSLLLGFVAFGMYSVAMAYSLIEIVLGIELVSLPTAFMIMVNGKENIEAAVKLFILSAIGITVLAFALVLLFPFDPQLSLTSISSMTGYLPVLALLLVIAGLAFEASIFPFNLWVPDVYSGAPANITAMLAGINKKVAFVALFEILFITMIPFSAAFSSMFQVLAVFTMFFGNIVALVQDNVKRLFAYSSISQAGYIAIGIAAATAYGVESSIFQIAAHLFMIIGTFAIILWLETKNIKTVQDYLGLSSRNRFAAFALTIFMLSMIGVPPLMGFVGKFLLFTSAINQGLLYLTLIAIINSFISIYYYARVMMSIYSKRPHEKVSMDWSIATVSLISLIVVILFGLYPQPFISIASTVSMSL